MAGIPDEIKALAELAPIEDFMLHVLRAGLPGIQVQSLIEIDQTFPMVMPRRVDDYGTWAGHPRFIDSASVAVHAFVQDPNGDEDAAILSEAVRVVLRNALAAQTVIPGLGHMTHCEMTNAPRRVSDWATAQGPVQYADLPTGVWRYQTIFDIDIRKSSTRPYPLIP